MVKTKDPNAVALGRKGGLARAKKLSKKSRVEIARKGGKAKADKYTPPEAVVPIAEQEV